MLNPRTMLLGAAGALAVLGAGTAFAQSGADTETRVIQVPKGAVVLVLPPGTLVPATMPGAAIEAGLPFAAMPDAAALMRQMDQMMGRMQRVFANPALAAPDPTVAAALRQAPGTMHSVVVTSVSNGRGTCTQTVTYAGDGSAPKVEVKATGDAACAPMQAAPVSSPGTQTPNVLRIDDRAAPVSAPIRG